MESLTTDQSMETKKARQKNLGNWIKLAIVSMLICLLALAVCLCTYPFFYGEVQVSYSNSLEKPDSLQLLVKSAFVLYKNLYEKTEGSTVTYGDLYMDEAATRELWEHAVNYEESYDSGEYEDESAIHDQVFQEMKEAVDVYFELLVSDTFSRMEQTYDYYAEDVRTGTGITNTGSSLQDNTDEYSFLVELIFDEGGNASVGLVKSDNPDAVFKNLTSLTREKSMLLENWMRNSHYNMLWNAHNAKLRHPVSCKIYYGIKKSVYESIYKEKYTDLVYTMAAYSGIIYLYLMAYICVAILAVFLPLPGSGQEDKRFFRMPLEITGILLLYFFLQIDAFIFGIGGFVTLVTARTGDALAEYLRISKSAGNVLAWAAHGLLLYAHLLVIWYLGLCLRGVRTMGIRNYIRRRSMIYRFFPFTKRKTQQLFEWLDHFDITKKAQRTILKIVLVNAAILFLISCMGFGGLMITIVYSGILYLLLKIYVSRIQRKYGILLSKINQISNGDLNVTIPEDLGLFEPFKLQLLRIQTGFRNAVQEEIKSQRMRAELITNVSHDLKTPLTAIITYVDLLKDEKISQQQRKEYLDTLERKSLRLKVLIEDLFEVSKASSGSIVLSPVDLDICNLIKQVQLELSDKLEAAGLEIKMHLPSERILCFLDSQRTFRIFENLIGNIAKYSLAGTRVYINGINQGANVLIELKNISATELTVNPEELTERFVRGDTSRGTEGSGLGLAIAKSLTELQGGHMSIQTDGDLFKAVIVFPIKTGG